MYLLLADQDFIKTADLKELLDKSPAGTDIVNCYSADTLLKLTESIKPELVIVDFKMIGEDVNELFQSLRKKGRNAHIIALIDSEYYDALNEVIDNGGVDDYIVKPISKEDFMARVHIAAKHLTLPKEEISSDNDLEERNIVAIPSDDLDFEEDFDIDEEKEDFTLSGSELAEEIEEIEEIDEIEVIDEIEEIEEVDLIAPDDQFSVEESPETEIEFKSDFEDEAIPDEEPELKEEPSDESLLDESPLEASLLDEEELLEPHAEQQTDQSDEALTDFFDLESEDETVIETKEQEISLGDYEAVEEDELANTEEDIFEDTVPFDKSEPQDIEEVNAVEDRGSADIFDNVSTGTPPAKTTFDTLFDDEINKTDLFYSQADPEKSKPEPEDSWDFAEDDLSVDSKDEELFFDDQAEEKPDIVKPPSASGIAAGPASIGEDYFEDLFNDSGTSAGKVESSKKEAPEKRLQEDDFDFFDDEPVEPPKESLIPDRESPFPGESADDFLFGDSEDQDFEQVPETVRRYVSDKDPAKKKDQKEDFIDDLFADDNNVTSRMNSGTTGRGKKSGITKFFSIIGNIVFIGLLLMMAVLSFFLIQSRISGGVPQVAGYQMYIVLSGSMSPEFDTGSLAFVRETSPMEIVVGDIITFRRHPGSDSLTTHRVVEVIREDGLRFVTRGDANNVNDPNPVPAENIVGRVTGSVPYVGYILDFVQTRQGLILLIFVPGVLIIVFELGKILSYLKQGESSKKKKSKKNHSHPAGEFDL